jgi:AraC-like DNA-binding protein
VGELIKLELAYSDSLPLNIPLPKDKRLQAACLQVLADPAARLSLEALAETAGASSKTLSRLCQKELGMSFATWRRRVRFAEALEQLEQGASVKQAAGKAGYDSPSAFSHAFHQHFGQSPSAFHGS